MSRFSATHGYGRWHKTHTALALFVLLLALLTVSFWSAGSFFRNAAFGLSFFFIVYWLVSVFVYLYKKARYGTYTRIIQRFWKRSLYLFWLLEVGLFCIYLFLTIISPQEVSYMLDNQGLSMFYNNDMRSFFESLLRPVTLLLLMNVYLVSHKFNSSKSALSALIVLLLIESLTDDFAQFFSANQYYNSFAWTHITTDSGHKAGLWELELSELKARPYLHYLYLLIFLKLLHTLFIVYFFLFFENARLLGSTAGYNVLSANVQNFFFLLFFNYILKIWLIKSYINYMGSFVYFWFFTNQNAFDFGYWYQIADTSYALFVMNDCASFI